ncbi:MAG: hypothetical protein Q8L48_18630 [Archangium sp.]|nr:hypothetical protein [Archangium sp.]
MSPMTLETAALGAISLKDWTGAPVVISSAWAGSPAILVWLRHFG